MEIFEIQQRLAEHNLDGWLLFDNHGSNRFFRQLLSIPQHLVITRRIFYFIPMAGEPVLIAHKIEAENLQFLPGRQELYLSKEELEQSLRGVLSSCKSVAMEYSPNCSNPYISNVDGGTLELVRSFTDVVSSDDLLQHFTSVLDQRQMESHLDAAQVLEQAAANAFDLIAKRLREQKPINEYEVQKFILSEFAAHNCITEDGPTCAVGAHSALPHYMARKKSAASINQGDFVLIDLWCKKDHPYAVYADITRVAVAAAEPTPRQLEVFEVVRKAQQRAYDFLQERLSSKKAVCGFEVDAVCRGYIKECGYGEFFTHRTGHNIDIEVHGAGAHLDNLETKDERKILPGTCFSIEPGIYLPGEFGVRLEHDVLISEDGIPKITGGIEESIVCLL
ncbi:MAG: M24 family metallopeptidase [Chlamydiae bacterium]|nr:M24 family metallopeptidase [Chlamydiota bacterium]